MTNESDLLRGNTPTLVLAILSEGPQHGYAIAQQINKRTGDSLKFKQGTLYPVLHTLEREGWVSGEWRHVEGERPRLVYAITESGRAALAEKVRVWRRFSDAMNNLIGGVAGDDRIGDAHERTA
ncbi:MAG: Transcriptional regulator, PadR family [Capsulimonas sp.]|jgi:PadR family transcriptional regulator PadR|nr:Transcriptional regulator, PadR family [Capsulimonas sp.]